MKNKIIPTIIMLIACVVLASAYTADTYTDIDSNLRNGYTADTYTNIDSTFGSDEICSCPRTGTWTVDCTNNCTLPACDMQTNNVLIDLIKKINPTDTLCYQETATTATSCGGLSTGSYNNALSNYIYINYSKPNNAVSGLWLTKHGTLSAYNSTIHSSCLNSDTLILRFYSQLVYNFPNAGTSYGQCYNGSNWITITSIEAANGWIAIYSGDYITTKTYDGNWNTGVGWVENDNYWYFETATGDGCKAALIYEEAIWWNIPIYTGKVTNLRDTTNATRIRIQGGCVAKW